MCRFPEQDEDLERARFSNNITGAHVNGQKQSSSAARAPSLLLPQFSSGGGELVLGDVRGDGAADAGHGVMLWAGWEPLWSRAGIKP